MTTISRLFRRDDNVSQYLSSAMEEEFNLDEGLSQAGIRMPLIDRKQVESQAERDRLEGARLRIEKQIAELEEELRQHVVAIEAEDARLRVYDGGGRLQLARGDRALNSPEADE